jgi:hypothetical protein
MGFPMPSTDLFPPGSMIGTYQVIRPLSAGGNAQVLVAWDSSLHREVALKILSGWAVSDPDQLVRIQREARVLAQLNHPNILRVIDLVRWQSQPVLVTELLEGRTLRAVLSEGPLLLATAVELAFQVASALDVVHRKGIIHRDIKPENLFLTTEGSCKLLDFGLAKALGEEEGHILEETFQTTAGLLQGTVGYLSPEQIGGRPVDGRSDIYALGLVLWELAKGKPPGKGRTALERQINVMKDGPGQLGSGYPAALEALLHCCLEVEPEHRYPDAGALMSALLELKSDPGAGTGGAAAKTASTRRIWPRRALLVGLVIAGALLGAGAWAHWAKKAEPPTFRRITFQRGNILRARFGPGGTSVFAGAALDGREPGIYRIGLEGGEVRSLGLRGADILSVSPSGELAVLIKDRFQASTFGSGTLARVLPGQDSTRLILDDVTGADWDLEGKDLAVTRRLPDGAYVLEYPVGQELFRSLIPLATPRFAPNGKTLAFMGTSPFFTLFVREPNGQVRALLERLQASDPFMAWMPDGRELILSGNTHPDWMPPLLAVDLKGRTRHLARFPMRALLHDVAADGRILFEREFFRLDMIWDDAAGEHDCSWLDGSQVAALDAGRRRILFSEVFEAVGLRPEVHLRDLAVEVPQRLGFGVAQDLSSDGTWALALADDPDPRLRLFPTGKGVTRDFPLNGWVPLEARFRPGHAEALVIARSAKGSANLLLLDLTNGRARPLPVADPAFLVPAPDGRRVALRTIAGRLVVLDLEENTVKEVGELPAGNELLGWTPDGQSVFFVEIGRWPIRVERIALRDGRRTFVRELGTKGGSAPARVDRVRMSPNGKAVAYSLLRITLSDLLVAQGLE